MIAALPKTIHCLGVGGAGMLPLALYLSEAGHLVSAEDDSLDEAAEAMLIAAGVSIGKLSESGEYALVYSSAISEAHSARVLAESSGMLSLRRGECLARIAKEKKLVAVAGSHGKTTTCAMLIDILDTLELEFGYLLGARFESKSPSRFSTSEWLVAEIDESDGTIEGFCPEITVVLNVDHDHHARYPKPSDYRAAFERLLARSRVTAILEAGLKARLETGTELKFLGVGEGGEVEMKAAPEGPGWSRLSLEAEQRLSSVSINRTGSMNFHNAAFALLAAREMGCDISKLDRVEFSPVNRRQRCWYNGARVQVFEDYAHHPEEIRALLESMPEKSGWQTVVVFQAHRYTRTREMREALAESLAVCEELFLLDVYAASEAPVEGGSGQDLYAACRKRNQRVCFISSVVDPLGTLHARSTQGPVRIVFLGAGIGDRLAKELSKRISADDSRWGGFELAIARTSNFTTQIREAEPMAKKTTMRVGGPAERYFEPESLDQLVCALKNCKQLGIEVRALGRGSNLVVPDAGVEGLVIRLSHPFWSRFERLGNEKARLGAGMRIKALCGHAAKEGLEGFEFLEGIPGSLGGVLRMNAGAMGGWVFDVVESIRYVTLDGTVIEANRDALEFGYRYCRELESAIAIDAVFVSKQPDASTEAIRRTIDTYQNKRKESQPREPSAGCIFKNPEGDSAGRLIDELGLKGTVVGGAEISEVHGNFIVNRGGAKSEDVIELVRFARKIAKKRKGIELHPEVLLFGAKWEDALK